MNDASNVTVVTTPYVPAMKVEQTFGTVWGLVVRSRGLGGNLVAGLRSLVGGEIKEYTQLLEQARQHAMERLKENAAAVGANAVVSMRFDSSELGQTMSEVVAYGTALQVVPDVDLDAIED